jgi:hypothetical protein
MHPIAVARIAVEEMGLGSTSICAALLHDVVEDTDYTVEDISNIFGEKIAQIVDGLTKISGGIFGDKASAQAENFKKLLLTMSDDIRVILIKICDRLHNMRTLQSQPANKQYKIAGETLYIYAPLANRLGLNKIKTELEDLSFRYEHPEEYDYIKGKLTDTDGSESLAKDENGNKIVTIKNIPEGSTLYGTDGKVIEAKDGIYTVKVDSNGDAKVTLTNSKELSDSDLDGIQASVISTDTPKDGSEAVSNAISFAGGGDIDLSNLKNIVNLKEINLDNGKENKLSLTLDDVLKLSGDDGKIKITGDMFDSVAFKKNDGWELKTENIGKVEGDKTFDVYTNSGNSTVQVKVEQPISDGFTN